MVRVEEQSVTFGKPENFPSYGWDNEYGTVTSHVPEFEASQYLITNREFLEFVEAGGYNQRKLWTDEGWSWREFTQKQHPTFWVCSQGCRGGCGADLAEYSHCRTNHKTDGDQTERHIKTENVAKDTYRYRLIFDEISMPMDWPVATNYHEARAYCAWRGPDYRLPTEAEQNLMRGPQEPVTEGVSSDIIYQDKIPANINFQYGSSTPVNLFPSTEAGFYDVFGNVWQWMEDHFNGLPGYQSHYLYDDFSTPCFDGRHNMILGGSWISTGDEASRFARFSFRRHFFQHCGFRMARSTTSGGLKTDLPARVIDTPIFVLGHGLSEEPISTGDLLEPYVVPTTNTQLNYDENPALWGIFQLEFGYRDSYASVAAEASMYFVNTHDCDRSSALHLGSGLGKTAFLLRDNFDKVLGVDFSGRFVDTAMTLQTERQVTYTAESGNQVTATLDSHLQTNDVVFKQWTWIPNEVGKHDLVLVTFLDRAQNPKAWLARLWETVTSTGVVVVVTRDGWDQERLAAVFGTRLEFCSSKSLEFETSSGLHDAGVTVWRLA